MGLRRADVGPGLGYDTVPRKDLRERSDCGLVRERSAPGPDIDHRVPGQVSGGVAERSHEQSGVRRLPLELAAVATMDSARIGLSTEHPEAEPLVVVVVGELEVGR